METKLVNVGDGQFNVVEIPTVKSSELVESIQRGDKVTILIPNGLKLQGGRAVQEWKEKTGTAVFRGDHGWVLNLGGRFGTPGIAAADNTIKVRKAKGGR